MVNVKHLSYRCFYCLIVVITCVQADAESRTVNETVRVAVASNFKPVLEQLATEFKRQNPSFQIQISSASSGVLYAQILRGAPFDLFLSADSLRPTLLEDQGITQAGSRRTYAFGKLVFWSPNNAVSDRDVLQHYSGKIAIANPELAPFGRASQQTLTALALWPGKNNNVVMANNVLQVAHMLQSGAVNLGLVSASQVKNVPKGEWRYVSQEFYAPIVQQMVILNQSNRGDQALAQIGVFYHYLLSANGQQIILNNGYDVTPHAVAVSGVTDG